MQLTSKRHSMVVEFRPHNILTDKFVYTLKFKGDTQSMRLFSKKEMIETCNSRLDMTFMVIRMIFFTDFLTEMSPILSQSPAPYHKMLINHTIVVLFLSIMFTTDTFNTVELTASQADLLLWCIEQMFIGFEDSEEQDLRPVMDRLAEISDNG